MIIKIVIVTGISVALGIVCGSGSVYAFNHIPDEWLGTDEKNREWQRVKSVPWKYVLAAGFIVIGIYLGMTDLRKAAGIYAACLILTQLAMAELLYQRTPRPLVWMLALTGAGIIPFTIGEDLGSGAGSAGMIKAHLIGAVTGFAVIMIIVTVKKLIWKKGSGTQAAELCLALGLLCGWRRVLTIIACGLIFWAGYILFKKFKRGGIIEPRISKDGMLEDRKINEDFFITVSAVFWMVAGAGLEVGFI